MCFDGDEAGPAGPWLGGWEAACGLDIPLPWGLGTVSRGRERAEVGRRNQLLA